jgi:coenzyme PQQ precursor peptide PqqA
MRGRAFSLAQFGAICGALLATAAHASQIEANVRKVKEWRILMAIATSLKPSVPKRFPPPIVEETTMKWTTPRVVEIAVGLEINSYARAELN